MKQEVDPRIVRWRVTYGDWASSPEHGNNGAFRVPSPNGVELRIIASDGTHPDAEFWEHVSVSVAGAKRCPNWPEMCFAKQLFWDDGETVIQFHPAKADYVNHHPFTLHLWRHRSGMQLMPPFHLVGPKEEIKAP
jgi:hypothetical protein